VSYLTPSTGGYHITEADQILLDDKDSDQDIYITLDENGKPSGIELITRSVVVPQNLPAWRVKAICDIQELTSSIEAALDAIEDVNTKFVAKRSWYEGNEIYRKSQLLVSMASGLGLTDEQLDNMFIAAGELSV
jgi:uncharacterized protein YuzE